ncbi:predicted protein [Lichtheimia corymbifera JMRC:FSU:9682]|uniref:Uncharacterized protein n=1 Tax=Lichtheimia corymbifera JMRC:FSU:9682 TaxID=1263082 RepID=A0A068SGZ8_9FUNG|nr:predicted protein [Lichtheimia corymbifera JMRC:FSU:9682]CDH61300.1 predicted protein [Lichtheimia corymbifera JMRC:FSU:9682]
MDTTTLRHSYRASATKAPKVHGSKYYGHGKAGPSTLLRLPRPYSNFAPAPATMLQPSSVATATAAAAASSTTMHAVSSMPTFVVQLPSSAVVQSDPNFGTNSPASTTTPLANNNNSINLDQQDHNNSNKLIGPIVGTIGGVMVICLVAFFLVRKRKRKTNNHTLPASSNNNQPWAYNQRQRKDSESDHSTLRENSAYHLHPPPAYTSRDAKRLTADTLVSIDQRSSLSTMVSKRQYMPQLAYSPSKASLNQRDQELGVSPSNTLIGTLSENDDDLKHHHNGRQRVPSYQPQVAMQPEEEPTIDPPPPAGEDIQSYYNYISQNETHSRSPTTEEPHDQKS